MIIIPALDLLDGKCVRLYKGDYSRSTVYDRDPVETVRSFEEAGAKRIHIVDLNAARADGTCNRETIARIRDSVAATIEVGGGIREDRDIEELAGIGVDRLIVGTTLARDPDRVERWAEAHPGSIIAGIDAVDGLVRVSGWEAETGLSDLEAARTAARIGAVEIIYTNIDRDGTLEGPDIDRCALVARESGLPVIVSGGVRGPEDFDAVVEREGEGLFGIITGKALYEGAFDLREMLERYA
jgi:phosphoribosylformimino-5-aminoimidazole carboxamide ribotide isomerase